MHFGKNFISGIKQVEAYYNLVYVPALFYILSFTQNASL